MASASHLQRALRWTTDEPADFASMLAVTIGMAVPLTLAAMNGHLELGLAGAVGSLLMGNAAYGRTINDLAENEVNVLVTFGLAAGIVAVIAEHGVWSDVGVVVVAVAAALIGGYSRALGVSTGRFIVFLCVTFSASTSEANAPLVFPLMGLTALWTSGLIFIFGAIARLIDPPAPLMPATDFEIVRFPERWSRWIASMRTLKGLQFPLRLMISLGLAVAIAAAFPTHRFFWIALTVALVCQRPLEAWPLRTTQRALGTFLGVILAALTIQQPVPNWMLIALLSLFNGIRQGLRTRNYLLFSAFMTPVIMLILDAGHPVEPHLLFDRFVATTIGALLTIAVNRVMVAVVGRWG
jgi:uncharacterized membrane protein YccC